MDASTGVREGVHARLPDEAGEHSGSGTSSEIAVRIDRESEAKWAARLVAAGSLLTLTYEVVFLVLDRRFLSPSAPRVLVFHSLNIALFLLAVIMAMRVGPWMRRHWKQVAFSFSCLMIVSSASIAIETGEKEPLTFALILFLAGTGPFLCWGEKLQSLLTVVAVVSFAVVSRTLPSSVDWYQWLGVLIGAAIGLFSTALERRQRRAQRRTEDELLKSREMLIEHERMRIAGQLAAGIAHDLNNTLNVIRLRFGLLVRDQRVLAAHDASLQAINRAIDDAARTVARVRELGIRRVAGHNESVSLAEVVDQAIDLATTSVEGRSSARSEPVRIVSELPADLPNVKGSVSELRQLFLNLFLNANDAMAEGGTIRVESEHEGDKIAIHVSDQGQGIYPGNLERIFEPFFTTKAPHGTGLGLALARKVMETIGGSITAANKSAGGAVFTLRFPVARPAEPVVQAHENAAPGPLCRFLVVDDDSENLKALKDLLIAAGHSVDAAASGSEALERLRQPSDYDVVLCDLDMPGISGWDVAKRWSESGLSHDFYIVTGWGTQAKAAIPIGSGVSAILCKPLGSGDIDRIIAAVESKRARTRISKSA